MTALHWAAKRGCFEACYLLIAYHSDINAIDVVLIVSRWAELRFFLRFSLIQ